MMTLENGGLAMDKAKKRSKIGRKTSSGEYQEGSLWKSILASKPVYSSDAEALAAFKAELANIAAENGKTIEGIIEEAHTSREFKPYHMRVVSLERRIAHFQTLLTK